MEAAVCQDRVFLMDGSLCELAAAAMKGAGSTLAVIDFAEMGKMPLRLCLAVFRSVPTPMEEGLLFVCRSRPGTIVRVDNEQGRSLDRAAINRVLYGTSLAYGE